MRRTRYLTCIIACLFALSACSVDQPTGKKISPFSFVDQNGQSFGTDDLTETVWVASFIFTNCNTVCPPMMMEMASLQQIFEEQGLKVEFVSFTVDPEVDSSEVLKQYIQQFTADESNWHMLTGYSQKEMEAFARDEFQTIVQKPDTSNQVIHGTNFYLVDDHGYLVNEYNYMDESYIDEMLEDIKNIRS